MPDPRQLLSEYLETAKVMQLATVGHAGDPAVCHLWFASGFAPDRLWFISRPGREHCARIRDNGRVAGAILNIELDELGGTPVRGVTFTGDAAELPTVDVDRQVNAYLTRWPKAINAIDPRRLAAGQTHHRIYEITVDGWILFDEQHFRDNPRRSIAAR